MPASTTTKRPRRGALAVQHAREQHARVAHQHPPGLEQQRGARCPRVAPEHRARVLLAAGRRLVRVGDAQPAADVQVLQRVALRRAASGRGPPPCSSAAFTGARVGELRADVAVQPQRLQPLQLLRLRVERDAPRRRARRTWRSSGRWRCSGACARPRPGSPAGRTARARPARAPTASSASSSSALSTLNSRMPARSAAAISSARLAHAREDRSCPARRRPRCTRASSPPDTMSKPRPARRRASAGRGWSWPSPSSR